MTKQVFHSLGGVALFLGSIVVACSNQTTPSQAQAGSGGGGASSGMTGVSGSVPMPPLGTSGSSSGGSLGSGGAGGAGGAAGAAGTATQAGSGGKPPYVPPVSSVTCPAAHVGGEALAIADFDDGLDVMGVDGRGGVWFGYGDGTGKQTDSPIPVVTSDQGGKAMHVTGSGFTNWGSGIGCAIAFDFQKNVQCPYDASAFTGLRVKVKGEGSVRLRLAQVATTPVTAKDRRGECDPNVATCDGHHEVTLLLTSTWTEHVLLWSDFKQVFGKLVDLDPKSVLGLNFEFNSHTTYDAWIDDIAFTKAGDVGGEGGAGGMGSGGAEAGSGGAE